MIAIRRRTQESKQTPNVGLLSSPQGRRLVRPLIAGGRLKVAGGELSCLQYDMDTPVAL